MHDFTSGLFSPSFAWPCCLWALPISLAILEFIIWGFKFLSRQWLKKKKEETHRILLTLLFHILCMATHCSSEERKDLSFIKASKRCLIWHLSKSFSSPSSSHVPWFCCSSTHGFLCTWNAGVSFCLGRSRLFQCWFQFLKEAFPLLLDEAKSSY